MSRTTWADIKRAKGAPERLSPEAAAVIEQACDDVAAFDAATPEEREALSARVWGALESMPGFTEGLREAERELEAGGGFAPFRRRNPMVAVAQRQMDALTEAVATCDPDAEPLSR